MTKNRNNLPFLEAFFWVGAILALAGFLFWLIAPSPARSQDRGWLPGTWERHIYLYRDHRPRRRRSESYYRSVESPSFREEERRRCFGRLFTDKGREFSSEEAALKDAERSWGALVREEPGEKWMDLKFAERYESRCQRSSTGESAAAKVTDTLTGGAYGTLYRCRIWAEPCTAPKTSDGGKER